jgi:hypothetical protein
MKPDHSLIVLDCSSTWSQMHHLLTIKFEYCLMSAIPESGAAHIASVVESASLAASVSFDHSTKKHQKVLSLTKKRKWSPKAKKAKKSPLFVMSVDDPFEVSPIRISFCVHGNSPNASAT